MFAPLDFFEISQCEHETRDKKQQWIIFGLSGTTWHEKDLKDKYTILLTQITLSVISRVDHRLSDWALV